jgi:hypothetical protein
MKHLIGLIAICVLIFVTIAHCNVKDKEKTVSSSKKNETFTSTEKYQIICWVIKRAEGYRSYNYRCEAKKKTTGWGFTHVKHVKDIHHADKIFHDTINPLFEIVKKEYPSLTYMQQGVIVSLIYNTGDLSSIKKSNFAKSLVKNNTDKALNSFLKWNKIKVKKGVYVVSKGLKNRRNYEAKLLTNSFTREDYNKLKSEISQIYKENRS